MRCLAFLVMALAVVGCGRAEPVLSGGKPIGYWLDAVNAPDPGLRKKAVVKLGNAGGIDAEIFPALLGALKDPNAQVRSEAVLALMKQGPQAREALPLLTAMQRQDRDARVRVYAGKARGRLEEND